MEIRKNYLRTDERIGVGARDTCVSKNIYDRMLHWCAAIYENQILCTCE